MKKQTAILGAILMLGCRAASAQPDVVGDVRQTFEDGQPSWLPFGENVRVGITRDPEHVKEGNAALQFDYTVQPNALAAMGIPPGAALARMKGLDFWIKTDHATPIVMVFQEIGGGRWGSIFYVPENIWQKVELKPSDFLLWHDADSPRDPNNQLDLDKVEGIGLSDFSQLLVNLPPALAPLFNVQPGPRTLWLDDVLVSTSARAQKEVAPDTVVIDDFSTPQLFWVPLGGNPLLREEVTINGAKMPGLRLEYSQSVGKFAGLSRRTAAGSLTGTRNFSLRAQAENATKLVLQLEEIGGGKYNTMLDLPAGEDAQTINFTVDNFKPADDSKDNNGQLDLAQVHQVLILDTAAFDPAAQNRLNSLWLGDFKARK